MFVTPRQPERSFKDGRDEMNLADFPISVLQRQQPVDGQGVKLDTVAYESSRYEPSAHRRLQQKVVLETTSRHGLPTPADENLILALLYVAKHTHNFSETIVHFAPRQLFQIMGWAPNSRSYVRLRQVLRRLKALVIRYENSWWDIAGRCYEAEVATGIISEYELVRQVSGRKKDGQVPPSWVSWTPHFQQSLTNGNLKKLDLDLLFSLRLPTAQRMYRFLDKRFYQSSTVEMDLRDFACGHIGLSPVSNVAELKRRLAPAIVELEQRGFLTPVQAEQRYVKVRSGIWRIRFQAAASEGRGARGEGREQKELSSLAPRPSPLAPLTPPAAEEVALVGEFYLLWDGHKKQHVGDSDLHQVRSLIRQYGLTKVQTLLPHLVQLVKRKWPQCKSLSGAVNKYGSEALQLQEQEQRRHDLQAQARMQQQQGREDELRRLAEQRQLESRWQTLPAQRRQILEEEVLRKCPEHRQHPGILKTLCLNELARQDDHSPR